MGTLTSRITNLSEALYGVNILANDPPKVVTGAATNVLAIVGEFPWGPEDEVNTYNTVAEALAEIYPKAFGSIDTTTYPAMKAFLGKRFPRGMKLTRVGATSAAKATRTFQDGEGTPADSVVVTATYKGSLGNSIQIAWSANADTAANRDMTVSIGTSYSVTYENVVVDNTGSITVTDPGDPYVTVAAAGGATDVPAVVAATALASGSDGSAVAADYVGSVSSEKGIRLFYDGSANVLFVAECPSALVDSVNAGLKSWADDVLHGVAYLCTVDGQASGDVLAYHTTYKSTKGRTVYCWPRVKTTNAFDADRATIEVDGNAFAAVAACNVDPWISPGGRPSRDYLSGITGLETEATSRATLETLRLGGTSCFYMTPDGAIIAGAMATDGSKVRRTRTQDWIGDSLAAYLENYAEMPLDLNLATETTGDITGAELAAIAGWLEEQKVLQRIKDYSVDPWSQNTEGEIDAGQWVIALLVELYSDQDKIVLSLTAGETVTIEAAA